MTNKFTGKSRYRVLNRLFKHSLLILQVEIKGYVASCDSGHVTGEVLTWWVDCKPEWKMENKI